MTVVILLRKIHIMSTHTHMHTRMHAHTHIDIIVVITNMHSLSLIHTHTDVTHTHTHLCIPVHTEHNHGTNAKQIFDSVVCCLHVDLQYPHLKIMSFIEKFLPLFSHLTCRFQGTFGRCFSSEVSARQEV